MGALRPLVGGLALLLVNHLLNGAVETGLPAVLSHGTVRTQPRHNASAAALYAAAASAASAAAVEADPHLLRVELMVRREEAAGEGAAGAAPESFSLLQVHHRSATAPPAPLVLGHRSVLEAAGGVAVSLDPPIRLTTVFPERSRWRIPPPPAEAQPPPLGDVALLVVLQRIEVADGQADAFSRAWAGLGYNALGEPGTVRCDLFAVDGAPLAFYSRKAFRSAADRAAHEASAHFGAWASDVAPLLDAAGLSRPPLLLDAVFPRSTPFPFSSGWRTA